MKKNLDLVTKLHYELNLENFFSVDIMNMKVRILGWHTPELEKLIFDKGYQLDWDEDEQKWIYDVKQVRIVLAIEPKI
jgi:beta-glucanase (GH16 family)